MFVIIDSYKPLFFLRKKKREIVLLFSDIDKEERWSG